MRMKSGIYKITNDITGKFYIGSTKDTDKRWYDHKRELTLNTHTNPKLQYSWNKHGGEKFTFTILEEVDPDQQKLFEREQYYLDTLKSYERNIGYNICPIASGGDNITHNPNRDAFIEKMKIITLGEKNGMYGKTHTEDTIKKQQDKAIGRFTLEWFVERYGKREGKKKYNNRRLMLANRKCNTVSRPNPNTGKSLHWVFNEGWLERRKKTTEYFVNHFNAFKQLVLSRKYSQRQLSNMLGVTRVTLRKHIKRI